jgi:hypothetical protein
VIVVQAEDVKGNKTIGYRFLNGADGNRVKLEIRELVDQLLTFILRLG